MDGIEGSGIRSYEQQGWSNGRQGLISDMKLLSPISQVGIDLMIRDIKIWSWRSVDRFCGIRVYLRLYIAEVCLVHSRSIAEVYQLTVTQERKHHY